MEKDPRSVLNDFVRRLTGHKVSYASLLLNSLRICVDRQLNEKTGFFLWLEPVWHVRSACGVLLGSRQAQTEDREAHAALNRIVETLVGRQVEKISLEPDTNDIEIGLTDGYVAKTFVSDPAADENWYLRDCRSNLVISGCAAGLRVRDAAPISEGSE